MPGKSSAPGVDKVFKLPRTKRRSGRARRRSRPTGESIRICWKIRTAQPRTLREAIGRKYGLDPARIVCGAGSDELLNFLARAYLGAGDEAIHTKHGFLVYKIVTLGPARSRS